MHKLSDLGHALGEFVYATKGLSVREALPLILKDILSLAPRFKCRVGFTSPVTLSFWLLKASFA